ncbi:MAG TPA: hypothetical protein ENL03_01040, partial [Phycisphaerae bacterium]|nr:hypothetical protein [Phycisphaerae bacterium]
MTGLTLALGFLAPLVAITGAAAASAPIIIHLLNRRRFKILDWAAMRFLLESLRKNRKRLRIEEIIMLVIRTLVVLLLAAFLGMMIWQSQTTIMGKGSKTVVFVLDDTYSLGQKHGDDSDLFALEKEYLIERLGQATDQDTITILRSSMRGKGDPFFKGSISDGSSRDSLVDSIRGLEVSHQRTPIVPAIEKAGDILRAAQNSAQLVILSDFRKVDFEDKAENDRLANILRSLQDDPNNPVDVWIMDYGKDAKQNLTVESLAMTGQFVVANHEMKFTARVRNNGLLTVNQAHVTLKIRRKDSVGWQGDVVLQEKAKVEDLAPGQSQTVEFEYKFTDAGPAVLVASVEEDDLAGDNAAYLAVDVKGAID